jgi:hypothetical protein
LESEVLDGRHNISSLLEDAIQGDCSEWFLPCARLCGKSSSTVSFEKLIELLMRQWFPEKNGSVGSGEG